eukprot:TRINITY_DN1414_c0_g1_i1.p1 TRINITY_DN1414_c0_g1~~TRINITY_DN1414_c0_g1_i1.p1  ORF type:complete len:137 (+),score=56.67 TRINITY_DN1414_c0_g1_i1:84-494(+)
MGTDPETKQETVELKEAAPSNAPAASNQNAVSNTPQQPGGVYNYVAAAVDYTAQTAEHLSKKTDEFVKYYVDGTINPAVDSTRKYINNLVHGHPDGALYANSSAHVAPNSPTVRDNAEGLPVPTDPAEGLPVNPPK